MKLVTGKIGNISYGEGLTEETQLPGIDLKAGPKMLEACNYSSSKHLKFTFLAF
jgi:hypothetical protein